MRMKVILIVLFLQIVKDNIVYSSTESACVNNECITYDLSGKNFESTTGTNSPEYLSTEEADEEDEEIESIFQKIGNGPKLISSGGSQDDPNIFKLPEPVVPNNSGNSFLIKKEIDTIDSHLNENPKMEGAILGNSTETEVTAIPKPKNSSKEFTNVTNTKDIYQSRQYHSKNQSEICTCDLKVKICDINCCCDKDCNANMKTVFTYCMNTVDKAGPQFCFNSKSIFKNNIKRDTNGLLCIVKNNFLPYVKFREEMIIDNVTTFNKRISRKKFFSYSPLKIDSPKMQNISYRFGDLVWSFSENKILPFGVPKQGINMQCNYKQNIFYLKNYETECLYSVPNNREKCMGAKHLGMYHFLTHKLIKSPALLAATNSSDKVCYNKTCLEITSYTCHEDSDLSSCVKSTPRDLQWDKTCKNIVSSVEYHIYHNGSYGVKEARAYFTLKTFTKEKFMQRIRLKFIWVNTPKEILKRSGNPGYIISKPIISGRKVYSNNETTSLRKEAIELSYNPQDWLTVVGSHSGVCSPLYRRSIGFGENAHYSCFVELENFNYQKKNCIDLQDWLLQLLLGEDFAEIKARNLNKFVATFGNSEVENTGDWVQIMIDPSSVIPSPITSASSDFFACKNVVSDLFIDVAYSKVGSIDKPQNKILGVRFYFGSPKNFVCNTKPNSTRLESHRNIKLSTYVHFIDLTPEARAEFAETPGFEAKLPHDFFYPFFSGTVIHSVSFFELFIMLLLVFSA